MYKQVSPTYGDTSDLYPWLGWPIKLCILQFSLKQLLCSYCDPSTA